MARLDWVDYGALQVYDHNSDYINALLTRADHLEQVYLPPYSILNFDKFCTWFAISAPRATELDLYDIRCTNADLTRLADMIDTTNRLVTLVVNVSENFGANDSAFFDAVGRSTTLKDLTFSHNFDTKSAAVPGNILTMLGTNKSLRRLKIDGLGLCSYTVSDVADAFAKNTTLKVLKFYNPRFDWRFTDIFAFLASNSTVEQLAIVGGSYWNQSVEVDVDIGKFIEANRSIKRLKLHGPDFSAGVIEGLAVALASNTSLLNLSLGWPLPRNCLHAFGAALRTNSTLVHLKLRAHWMARAVVLTSFVKDVVQSNTLRTIQFSADQRDTVVAAFSAGIDANFALSLVTVNDGLAVPEATARNRIFHGSLCEVDRTAFRCLIFCWEECGKRGAGAVSDVGTVPVDLLANILLNTLSQRVRRVVFELKAGPVPRRYDIARDEFLGCDHDVEPLPSSAATRFAEFMEDFLVRAPLRAGRTRVGCRAGSAPEDQSEPALKKARSSE